MKPIPVIACANSRLHADVMLIRLRRAGIACNTISALFPRSSMPNAVACWLRLDQAEAMHVGRETIMPAGKLRGNLNGESDARALVATLVAAGIDRASAKLLEEKLEQGHTLIAVTAANETNASIAWHVFKHAASDLIVVGHGASLARPMEPAVSEMDAMPALSAVAA